MEMCYNYYKIMKPGDTMLTSDEVLNLNYYKKTSYTGWINGMRFLIRREAPEDRARPMHEKRRPLPRGLPV